MKKLILMCSALLLPNCASIASGTKQTITVNTNPSEASCEFLREGKAIGQIQSTPGSFVVERLKYDIVIECSKAGYQTATYVNESGSESATLGNILLGGGVGWAIDSASGADNSYTETVNITLPR